MKYTIRVWSILYIYSSVLAKARKPFSSQLRNTTIILKDRFIDRTEVKIYQRSIYINDPSSDACTTYIRCTDIILFKSRPKYDSQRPKRTPGGSAYDRHAHRHRSRHDTHTCVRCTRGELE